MKKTITEIFIEVEEIIQVKLTRRKKPSTDEAETDLKPVIEICPHCQQAIFDPTNIELKGDLEI